MGCFRFSRIKKKCVQPISASISAKYVVIEEIKPVALPEPQPNNRSLQSAPPSFKIRSNSIQPIKRTPNGRNRALSAPSSLDVTDEIIFSSIDFDAPNPQPLPLPSLQNTASLTNFGSFKSVNINTLISSWEPLPLPPLCSIKNFSYEEIAHACQNFSFDRCKSGAISSNMYKASFGDDSSEIKKLEATVACLVPSSQGLREFINEVNIIGSLHHPQLCKLLGFHAREGSNEQMLVYERLFYGSLDQLLYEQSDGSILDWSARIKIALCAAQGLAFLHEEGPFQAMYNEFSTTNIQVDKDFSAKLSGYGCLNHKPDKLISMTAETQERELLTPKSNVWSFGIILLELLTGRKNLDTHQPNEEKNLIKWTRPFLADDSRLSLIMDPQLKCRFPSKAARVVADIASKCLHREPSERPTMRTLVESLKSIQEMKYLCKFPLQEPSTSTITIRTSPLAKIMNRSPSLSGIIAPAPGLNPSPSPPSSMMTISSTSLLPPRSCSSVSFYDRHWRDEKPPRRSSSTTTRRGIVEGF